MLRGWFDGVRSRWPLRRVLKYGIGAGIIGYVLSGPRIPMPSHTVLTLQLNGPVVDQVERSPLAGLLEIQKSVDLTALIYALDQARNDGRVLGLSVEIGPEFSASLAQAQELQSAFRRFTEKKLSMVHTSGMAGASVQIVSSAFDRITIEPNSALEFAGIGGSHLYLASFFEKLGIRVEAERRHQYKGAPETFTNTEMSEPQREQNNQLLDSLESQIIKGLVAGRKLPIKTVKSFWGKGLMLPSEAKQIGLIDQVASLADYRVGQQSLLMLAGQLANQKDRAGAQIPPVLSKELIVELTRRKEAELRALRVQPAQIPPTAKLPASTEPAGSSSVMPALGNFLRVPPSVPMDYYMKAIAREENKKAEAVGVICVSGPIKSGSGMESDTIFSDHVIAQLDLAARNPKIRAVVLRVDSPGGDAIASSEIASMLGALKMLDKPVVVSMGTYAASGGYLMALPGSRILANPATITGSIGTFILRPSFQGMLEKLEIKHEHMGRGEASRLFDPFLPWDETAHASIRKMADHVYSVFTNDVAKARKMTLDEVDRVARGRVFTGEQAVKARLVDQLGGFNEALETAQSMAKFTQPADNVPVVWIRRRDLVRGVLQNAAKRLIPGVQADFTPLDRLDLSTLLYAYLVPRTLHQTIRVARVASQLADRPEFAALETLAMQQSSTDHRSGTVQLRMDLQSSIDVGAPPKAL